MPGLNDTNPEISAKGSEQPGRSRPVPEFADAPAAGDTARASSEPGVETGGEPSSVQTLLAAMGNGEREAAAEFVTRYGPQIRRRVRGKLRASMRRLFDSQDILSTLSRRLDVYVQRGKFEPRSEAELWGLVFTIAERSVVEKARIWQALSEKEGERSGLAREAVTRYERAERGSGVQIDEPDEFEELLESVPLQIDRQIARLWAMDLSSEAIAAELGLTPDVVRTRWCRTRARLRSHFTQEAT